MYVGRCQSLPRADGRRSRRSSFHVGCLDFGRVVELYSRAKECCRSLMQVNNISIMKTLILWFILSPTQFRKEFQSSFLIQVILCHMLVLEYRIQFTRWYKSTTSHVDDFITVWRPCYLSDSSPEKTFLSVDGIEFRTVVGQVFISLF